MIRAILRSLLPGHTRQTAGAAEPSQQRPRESFLAVPSVIYAVGDVHGHLELLRKLERQIAEDSLGVAGEKWIVLLGDFVDRGPASAQVIDHLLGPAPHGFTRKAIAGNHELIMSRFLANPQRAKAWLSMGGLETLVSYGIPHSQLAVARTNPLKLKALIESHIPDEHMRFLLGLPTVISVGPYLFVHAGVRDSIPLASQTDDQLTMGDPSEKSGSDGPSGIVVHGHFAVDVPRRSSNRINVDTGAYISGKLSAARLEPGGGVRFISVQANLKHWDASPF